MTIRTTSLRYLDTSRDYLDIPFNECRIVVLAMLDNQTTDVVKIHRVDREKQKLYQTWYPNNQYHLMTLVEKTFDVTLPMPQYYKI